MRLVLLSSLTEKLDPDLEDRIKRMVSEKGSGRLGYIPSQFDRDRFYFHKMKPNLERLGFREFCYCDVDEEYKEEKVEELTHCDAIFLSGGNTFYFLYNLQLRNLVNFLADFARAGGMLIGVSAGAMVMSPTIDVAAIIDPNDVHLKDTCGLDLAKLHVLPHYSKELHHQELTSRTTDLPVYGCPDDSGIVIDGGGFECYGKAVKME